MTPVQSSNVVLVVADSNFVNLCKDPAEYVTRLKKVLGERANGSVTVMTVSGKYGLGNVDETLGIIPVDDKNKTVFGQTLENMCTVFDELLAVTNSTNDSFISTAKEVVGNASKTITTFGYPRKG